MQRDSSSLRVLDLNFNRSLDPPVYNASANPTSECFRESFNYFFSLTQLCHCNESLITWHLTVMALLEG